MRVFLDANILLSTAINPDGRAGSLVKLGRQGRCILITSPYALREISRNLAVKSPRSAKALPELLAWVEIGIEGGSHHRAWAREQGLPVKDVPILAAAIANRADLLATGDQRHFARLYGTLTRGVLVLTPADSLAYVAAASETLGRAGDETRMVPDGDV